MDIVERLRSPELFLNTDRRDAAYEIERLRGAIIANQSVALDALATHGQLCDEIERLRDVLQMWVKFWNEDGDDVWMAEEAMMATNQI